MTALPATTTFPDSVPCAKQFCRHSKDAHRAKSGCTAPARDSDYEHPARCTCRKYVPAMQPLDQATLVEEVPA